MNLNGKWSIQGYQIHIVHMLRHRLECMEIPGRDWVEDG